MEVKPYEGLGALRFDLSRSKVRESLGPGFKSFRKTRLDETLTDAYSELGLHLYYDKTDSLEFIEAFRPCMPIFRGIELLGLREPVVDALQGAGVGLTRRESDADFFDDFGFVLYSPSDEVEGVSVFKRGYYDSEA